MTTNPAFFSVIDELARGLQISRNVNYATLAGFVTAYFDWLLTFDSEIKLIWNAKGVKMKVLYLITRYLPLLYSFAYFYYRFGRLTASECDALCKAGGTMFVIAAIGAELIVTLRTWAIWAMAKPMAYALFGTATATAVFSLILWIISWREISHLAINWLPIGCVPHYASYVPVVFVVEAAYDSVILLLLLIRGASLYRLGRNSPLFQTVYHDGILLYICITAVSVTNVILLFGKGDYQMLFVPVQGALRSVFSCRIVLHIRMKDDELVRNGLSTIVSGPSTAHFE